MVSSLRRNSASHRCRPSHPRSKISTSTSRPSALKHTYSYRDEESMSERETPERETPEGSGFDEKVRSPIRTRSRVRRESGLPDPAPLQPEQNSSDDTSDAQPDHPYIEPPIQSMTLEERLTDILQGASMHDGRKTKPGTDPFTKVVVRLLNPHTGQCLLTRELVSESEIEFSHLLFQADRKDEEFITRLEYILGLKFGQFNIDDARNVFEIEIKWHRMLDKKRGILLPDMDIVSRIFSEHKATEDIRLLYTKTTDFQYRFLPLFGGSITSILRYERDDDDEQPASANTRSRIYHYPFHDLPPLQSHVDPHYVIINAAKKLEGIGLADLQALVSNVATVYKTDRTRADTFISNLREIYRGWKTTVVPKGFKHPGWSKTKDVEKVEEVEISQADEFEEVEAEVEDPEEDEDFEDFEKAEEAEEFEEIEKVEEAEEAWESDEFEEVEGFEEALDENSSIMDTSHDIHGNWETTPGLRTGGLKTKRSPSPSEDWATGFKSLKRAAGAVANRKTRD